MKRVLIVAYYFPPIGGIGSIRLSSLASHLPEFGWEPVVLAPASTPHPSDPELSFPEDRVIRSRSLELSRAGRPLRVTSTTAAQGRSGRARRSVREIGTRMAFPDMQVGWWPGAVASGLRLVRHDRFDAVFSSSFPVTAHLVGMVLGRAAKLPWVAEFRDPWSDRLPRVPYRRAARGLERYIASAARQVMMPSPTWAEHFGALWRTDVEVLPNGHEQTTNSTEPTAPPTLTHVGSHYPEHHCDFSTLWEAVGNVRRGQGGLPRLRWVGAMPEQVAKQLARAGITDVEVSGPVSHEAATRLTREASMLFAAGPRGRDPISRGWVPGKVFEYIASGRSVLYLGDPAGDAAALLHDRAGCYVCEPSDRQGIAAALETGLATTRHRRETDSLSRRAGARTFAMLLNRALVATG